MGERRRARERALQALYQLDVAGGDPLEALRAAWAASGEEPEAETAAYAERLVVGTVREREAIDARIQEKSHHWRLARMAKVDRNVLRLAVFELLHGEDVPRNVVLNEAVELAKRFGGAESSAFVNGILDQVAPPAPGEEAAAGK